MGKDPFIGVDLRLHNGDLGYSQLGDIDMIGDQDPTENVWQAVVLRLTTIRGENYFVSEFGSNSGSFVDEPLTDNLKSRIEADAKNAILEDPRIASIVNFSVTQDGNSLLMTFTIITMTGQTKTGSVMS